MKINQKVFDQFPVIQTERLLLRQIQLEDTVKIMEMRQNNRVNQFIARTSISGLEAAEELVKKTVDAFESKVGIGWAGILRNSSDIIGTCGFNRIDYLNNRAEIGGELSTEYWGKNIALEAVQAIVTFGFDQMNLHAIEALVSPENRGAIFLLEYLGFEKEAHFKDRIYFNEVYSDMVVYTLFKS
ncbi:GNAT family N-acetyltransferase [Fluviicola taffensis]|uniref:GCN5-related N-acetyltransferase n=1 Tax=Fluviicola taffensis (strain DSM 16823 / NCIMB 13979 / RW262) TaxID=755732 RepID=F2IIL0_FLUTR|nr:GNAT family protein [Fluviicola taffensis]AEA45972.1 GCN5-related N-acetyltransferase [Fluviicola taffensis DSM 16823]